MTVVTEGTCGATDREGAGGAAVGTTGALTDTEAAVRGGCTAATVEREGGGGRAAPNIADMTGRTGCTAATGPGAASMDT